MTNRADPSNAEPVTLPVHCTVCGGKVQITYAPGPGPRGEWQTENIYRCPHCDKMIRIALPGGLLPPVDRDDTD